MSGASVTKEKPSPSEGFDVGAVDALRLLTMQRRYSNGRSRIHRPYGAGNLKVQRHKL